MHSINNKLYLAGLFSCEPADLPGDCREYKGSLTTQNDIQSDKNRIQGADRMQIGSENEMICLICHEELHFSEIRNWCYWDCGVTGPVLKISAIITVDRSIPSVDRWLCLKWNHGGTRTGAERSQTDGLKISVTVWAELSVTVMMTVEGPTLRRPRRGGFRTQCSSTRHLVAHLGTMIAGVQPVFEALSARA